VKPHVTTTNWCAFFDVVAKIEIEGTGDEKRRKCQKTRRKKKTKMSKPIIVSIDGNIGSGKSTLLKQLQDRRASQEEIVFVKEPVDEWASIRD
jgi:ABC-type lipoprotein export system ATPase subunit